MSGPLSVMSARAQLYARAVPSAAYLQFVCENGLALRSLADRDPITENCGCLAVTRVRSLSDGGFEFAALSDEGATLAAVIEVFGRDGETATDIVAWSVADPSRFRTMFGAAVMLGLARVFDAFTYSFDKPLQIHRTPLAWLQAGCRGAVVLDAAEAARCLLEALGPIAGEDRQHTHELAASVRALADDVRFVVPVAPLHAEQKEAA